MTPLAAAQPPARAPEDPLAPRASATRVLDLLLLAVIAAGVAFLLASVEADPDLWGRIAYGQLAVDQGRLFATADVYSYTAPGAPWTDHEYGFSWLAWAVHEAAGWPGLRLLRIALFLGTLGLCLPSVWPSTRGSAARLLLLLTPCVIAMAPGFMGPRAQSLTFLLFAWLLFCLHRAGDDRHRWLAAAVLPMPLWVNLHGGVLAGCGVLFVWGSVRAAAAWRRRDWSVVAVLAAAASWCVASLSATPWGADYLLFLLRTATMDRPFVAEWSAPRLLGANWWLVVLLSLAVVLMLRARPRAWAELAAVAVVAFAAIQHQRHLPFLAIAVLIFAVPAVLGATGAAHPLRATEPPRRAVALLGAVLASLLILLLGATTAEVIKKPPAEPYFPAAALAELQHRDLQGGLLVDFEWSQYVIFHRPPGVQVAFDGRYEAVYPDSVIEAFIAWTYGHDGWEQLPDDPRTSMALVGTESSRQRRLLGAPGWSRVYSDEVATLFVKADSGASSR